MSNHSENRHATWLELFFGLIFVVAIAKTAHVLQHPHDGHIAAVDYLKYILILIPVWWAWVGATMFANRYECDDVLQRFMSLAQMFAVIILAAHINTDFDSYYHGFLYAYLAIRVFTIMMHLRASFHTPDKKHISNFLALIFTIGAVITLSSALFEGIPRYSIFYVGIAFDMIMPLVFKERLKSVSVHSHHLPERFGLLTIILLGEAILSLTNSVDVLALAPQQVLMAICSFVLVCSIWWNYFDNLDKKITGKDLGHGHGMLYLHLTIYAGLGGIAAMARYAIEPELALLDYKTLSAFSIFTLVLALQALYFIYHPREARKKMMRNSMIFNGGLVALLVLAPSVPVIMVGTTILLVSYVALEQRQSP